VKNGDVGKIVSRTIDLFAQKRTEKDDCATRKHKRGKKPEVGLGPRLWNANCSFSFALITSGNLRSSTGGYDALIAAAAHRPKRRRFQHPKIDRNQSQLLPK
jgi:hypothetical protein